MKKTWVEVARLDELPKGSMKRIEIDSHRYLIVNAEGTIYAVDDRCSHEDISLYLVWCFIQIDDDSVTLSG
ncbi:MAG: Rieske 2Fe-2S domain-containing protein [Candidatus Thiodiazotropha sp.]|jgi:nitrite reductase/ring-hydroxylating ferredoxin subunit